MAKKTNKPKAYSWVAYMITHEPEEMQRVRKYGTPSERLIKLAEQPVGMTLSNGKFTLITFPESLNKSRGQKLLFDALKRIDIYLKTIPTQAYDLYQHIKTTLHARRKDATANLHMVADAILHRAACEFKHEVLFAFDSINTWIKTIYNKELGYVTIRKALEVLAARGFIKVNEWGKRGNRSKCTKIEFIPLTKEYILTYTSKVDDWLLYCDHAMNAVYQRESITRQDVLESRFHHFADEMAEDLLQESRWSQGVRLFSATDDRMIVVTSVEVTQADEKVFEHDETYFDRLLGGLVPSLQANGSDNREIVSGILQPD